MATPQRKARLSHIDAAGRPRMVDVSAKADTAREAVAKGSVYMRAETLRLIVSGGAAKGDVLYLAGEIGRPADAERIRAMVGRDAPAEVREAAEEAIKKLQNGWK